MSIAPSSDQVTTPSESGRTWDAEIREVSLPGCELLLAPPMGNSPPSFLMAEPFESGIDTETEAAAGKPLREHKI